MQGLVGGRCVLALEVFSRSRGRRCGPARKGGLGAAAVVMAASFRQSIPVKAAKGLFARRGGVPGGHRAGARFRCLTSRFSLFDYVRGRGIIGNENHFHSSPVA